MCGIPLLLLKRVNKPTTKDNWLVYRHRSDRGEGERGRLDVRLYGRRGVLRDMCQTFGMYKGGVGAVLVGMKVGQVGTGLL